MTAPTLTLRSPPPARFFDPGILRPQTLIAWTGGTGPYDVLHEWDTDAGFSAPLTDANASATSPDTGTPPSDLGPAGTTWYYRVKVTDTSDATSSTTATKTLTWTDPIIYRRYLYLLADLGVGFDPTDTPAAGWGPAAGSGPVDGYPIEFRRYLYLLANVGVGFDPTDTPAAGWGPAAGSGPVDGYTLEFRRYLYLLANVDTTVPTPHIWYVFPAYGRVGWEFLIVGYGFGNTQAAYAGTARLNAITAGVITWLAIADTGADPKTIDHLTNIATPIHQEVAAQVPIGGESGLVYIDTDA